MAASGDRRREGGTEGAGASRRNDATPRLLKGASPLRRRWRRRVPGAPAASLSAESRAGRARARAGCADRARAGRGPLEGSGGAAGTAGPNG